MLQVGTDHQFKKEIMPNRIYLKIRREWDPEQPCCPFVEKWQHFEKSIQKIMSQINYQ